MDNEIITTIRYDMKRAERQAWKSLAGYKFLMFGYHAAVWVNLNKLLPERQPNPFKEAVFVARYVLSPKKRQEEIKTWINSLPEPK